MFKHLKTISNVLCNSKEERPKRIKKITMILNDHIEGNLNDRYH